MKPIVIVAYGGGHVSMLAPVTLALRERGTPVVFLALTTAGAYLDRLGISYISYRDLPGAQDEDVQAWGHELIRDFPLGGLVPREESVAYMGLNYQDLVARLGGEGARKAYEFNGRQAFLPVALFRRWLAMVQPALVVATNSPRSERAALEAAGTLGIPTLCAVDLFGDYAVQWIKQPGYATRICVLNEQVRDSFVREGCRPEALVVTGNPAFERLQLPDVQKAGRAMRQAKGWSDGETVVLWASQVEPQQHPFIDQQGDSSLPQRVEQKLREFIAEQQNFRLVVRYHPSEHTVFSSGQERVEQSVSGEDLSVLLHAVDIVVILTSTVGLQAHLAGRTVISVGGSMFSAGVPYGEMGIATEIASLDLLAPVLLEKSAVVSQSCNIATAFRQAPTQKIIEVIDSIMVD